MKYILDIEERNVIFYYTVKYYDSHFEIIATKKYTAEIMNTLNRSNKMLYLEKIAWTGTYIPALKNYIRVSEPTIIDF